MKRLFDALVKSLILYTAVVVIASSAGTSILWEMFSGIHVTAMPSCYLCMLVASWLAIEKWGKS